MSVLQLVLRRVLIAIPLMIGLTLIVFLVSHLLPGDPVAAHLGQRSMENPVIVAAFREQWGLDRPLHVQYLAFLGHLLRGNLGVSIKTKDPVVQDLARYFPASVELDLTPNRVWRTPANQEPSLPYWPSYDGSLLMRIVSYQSGLIVLKFAPKSSIANP